MTNFSPVRITDPSSEFHTVTLHKGQDIVLQSKHAQIDSLKINSKYINTKNRIVENGGESIVFEHIDLDEGWDATSTFHMGEIIATTKETIKIPPRVFRLCLFLESSNPMKKDVITVVDPIDSSIKLDPHQILEVVVCNPEFGSGDIWDCVFVNDESAVENLNFHTMGRRPLPLGTANLDDFRDPSDIYYLRYRNSRFSHPTCREHHFWFRFDNRILGQVSSLNNDIYYTGSIEFVGRMGDSEDAEVVTRRLKIFLNQKTKFKDRVEKTLLIKDLETLKDAEDQFIPTGLEKPKESVRKNNTCSGGISRNTSLIRTTKTTYAAEEDSYFSSYRYSGKTMREIHIDNIVHDELHHDCFCLPILVADKSKLKKIKTKPDGSEFSVLLPD